ncbi:MAG: hypothetical protein LBT23_05800 [Synergistaceae bacterium]|jgi:hypothetical protein|nr:hypothetical protein [Synergistaceae bacterium]
MIESFIEGRIRLRSPLLADKTLAGRFMEVILTIEGVRAAEVNNRTCGLLLEYDTKRIPMQKLLKAAPILESVAELTKLDPDKRFSALEEALDRLKEVLA